MFPFMISATSPNADTFISNALVQSILSTNYSKTSFVFFCIGTNLVSGDSLGPLIGSQLKQLHLPHTAIYGTWEQPVHALNLEKTWKDAKKKHPGSCFIAIDASFGSHKHMGHICIDNRPVLPGRGVGKNLPPIGDIAITGIVCPNCFLRHKHLERIPLSFIQRQANAITSGIVRTLLYFFILQKT